MDKNMDHILNSYQKQDGKKDLMKKLKEEKQQKQQNKLESEKILIIQKQVKQFISISKIKQQLIKQTQGRLQDIENLRITIKNKQNKDFCLPLKVLNDFLRDFNVICFRISSNKVQIQRLKPMLKYLGYWIHKSCQNENYEDNIFHALYNSLLHGSEDRLQNDLIRLPRVQKGQQENLQDRSYLNLTKFLQHIFNLFDLWPDELISAVSFIFDSNNLNKFYEVSQWQKFNNQAFETQTIHATKGNLLYMSKLFENFYINNNVISKLQTIIKKYILHNLLSLSTSKDINPQILSLLKIAAFPITLFFFINQQSQQLVKQKVEYDKSYNNYIQFQSHFIMEILQISQISHHLVLLQDELKLKQSQFSWKNMYQSFIFDKFKNPLDIQQTQKEFKSLFKNKNDEFLNILANSVAILDNILKQSVQKVSEKNDDYKFKDKINEYLALLKMIHLSLNLITPSQLSQVLDLGNMHSEKIRFLNSNITILLNPQFAIKLFNAVFSTETVTTKDGKQKIQFQDNFNPMIAMLITGIYSRISILCYSNKNYAMIQKVTYAFAFNLNVQKKLIKYLEKFIGIDSYNQGVLDIEERQNYLSTLTLFILAYSSQLIITDPSDFFTGSENVLSKQKLKQFVLILISLVSKFMFEQLEPQEQVQCQFIVEISSKLLKQLYEYNHIQEFIPRNQWLIQEIYREKLENEIVNYNFSHLYIIRYIPFGFTFEGRLQILRILFEKQRFDNNVAFKLLIRRDNIFEDGYECFKEISTMNLKARLVVFYINELGMEEQGIDAGGIFKEFINDLSKIVFDPNYGLFKLQENTQQLYPNPSSQQFIGNDHLNIFYFIGGVVGRAIYDDILLSCMFSQFFLRKMIGKHNSLIELQNLDEELYKNLKYLKNYDGDASDLGINFTVQSHDQREIELIPNGQDINVDNSNKLRYIYLVAQYKLNSEIKRQVDSFIAGLQRVVNIQWLQMFDEVELQKVISGEIGNIDVEDMRLNSKYEGYSKNDSFIKQFFKVVDQMSFDEQKQLMKFVTSCERAPLLGFKNLNPPFTFVKTDSEKDTKLPSASTCFNRLYLPKYSSQKILEQKLKQAISQCVGFHLA